MIKSKVVGFLSFCLITTVFSHFTVHAGDKVDEQLEPSQVEVVTTAGAQAVVALSSPTALNAISSTVVDSSVYTLERVEQKEVLDFTDQLVVFDVNDYEDPVVYDDCHVTTYCNCERCCGKYAWKHTTSTGAETIEGITIAVDPKVIPYGSIVELDGHFYIAQDCGGAIDGIEIDVYIEDVGGKHTRCYQFMHDLGQDYGNTIRVWMPKQ